MKSKGGGKLIPYKGDSATAQQSCCIASLIPVNQLRIYGAVSDWCEELAQQVSDPYSSSTGELVAELNGEAESESHPMLCQS